MEVWAPLDLTSRVPVFPGVAKDIYGKVGGADGGADSYGGV